MKIIADSAIPFLQGVLEPWAEVRYLPGAEIAPEEVRGADAPVSYPHLTLPTSDPVKTPTVPVTRKTINHLHHTNQSAPFTSYNS